MRLLPVRSVLSSLLVVTAHLGASLGFAGAPSGKGLPGKEIAQVAEAHPMYLGTVNSGIKTNDAYTDGNFSIVAPLWSSLGADATLSGGVLFLEPYVSYGEGGEVAASLGLGYRHLFGTQSVSALTNHDGHQAGFLEEGVFIGANLFVDMLDTEADNQFWQLGVGLEAGTRYLEVRGNYYIPLSDKQVAEEFHTREQFQTTSSQAHQTATPVNGGTPYATGNAIVQDAIFATTVTTTTRTTTIERLFRRYEEGIEGWDAELALLVPGLDKYFDLRFIGGYYSFDNQPFGPQEGGTGNVEGWKVGVEIRPVPAVILTGTWYEDERLTGSDWTAGVQFQVPFEIGDLGDGKGFWDRIGDAFTPRRRHLVERLAEPVHRQNAAVKIADTVEEEETETTTSVKRVTKVISRTQGQLVLADDIVFVNNGEAVGNGIQAGDTLSNGANGTAEHPYFDITNGATIAGQNSNATGRVWSVYTQGGNDFPYGSGIELPGSVRFISSFTPIVAPNGRVFGGNTARPVMIGSIVANNIPFVQVTGYEIQGGGEGGSILAENVQQLLVTDNILNVEYHGVTVIAAGGAPFQATIARNQIATQQVGVLAETYDPGTFLDIRVAGNDFLDAGSDGVLLRTRGNNTLHGTVSGNRFLGDMTTGVLAESNANSTMLATIADNTLSAKFTQAVWASSNDTSTLTTFVQGNTIGGSYSHGIHANHHDVSTLIAHTLNNTLTGKANFATINYYSEGATGVGSFTGTIQGNILSGTLSYGIRMAAGASDAIMDFTVAENVISGTGMHGILVEEVPGSSTAFITARVVRNVLSGSLTNGIYINPGTNSGIYDTDAIVTDNLLTGSFSNGIVLRVDRGDTLNAVVSRNILAAGSSYLERPIFFETYGATGGIMNVIGFDGNIIEADSAISIVIVESSGTLNVNGSLNPALSNQVTNGTGNKLQTANAPAGSFFLNGVQVTLPTTVP